MALITLDDIRTYKDIETSAQHIDDAELVDLKPLLGEKMYFDLVANKDETSHDILFNGGSYTYEGFEYTCPGIKMVLSEFAYARITFFGNEKSTPFGLVEKNYQDARMATRDRTKERYTASQQIAMVIWNDVRAYLDRNYSSFQYWDGCSSKWGITGFRLTHIR